MLALAHYECHADEFWQGTRDHHVSQIIAARCGTSGAPPPFDLHDFGCGQGSDLKKFRQIVHQPTGLEGATRLATMARAWQPFSKRRIPRTDSLIPPRRPADRTAVLACQRVAQAGGGLSVKALAFLPKQRAVAMNAKATLKNLRLFGLLPAWSTWLTQVPQQDPMYC